MSFFAAYLFNPWHASTRSQKPAESRRRQHAAAPTAKKNDDDEQAAKPAARKQEAQHLDNGPSGRGRQPRDEEFTSFPPFIPAAPDPHGTKEFIRAVIAEATGTIQQVRKAGEDIRRVNEEALRQVRQQETNKTTEKSPTTTTSLAASSLKAILARCPPPPSASTNQEEPPSQEELRRPPLVRQGSSCSSYNSPVPPSTRIPTSPGNGNGNGKRRGAKKKPSFFQIRLPTEPKRILPRQDRHRRPSPTFDPRLSPLGPMAERLMMAVDAYDSERDLD